MEKLYSLLGLAQRAGKISSGTLAARNSLMSKRAYLLVCSSDIAENTRDSLLATCNKYEIPYLVAGNKYELGNAVGKAYRVAVAVNDKNLARAMIDAAGKRGNDRNRTGVVEWPK